MGTPVARKSRAYSTLWPGTPPPTRVQIVARALVRGAGWICESRAHEWWADLIVVQEEHGARGVSRPLSCLLGAPVVAWPEFRLRAVGAFAELMFEAAFSGVRSIAFVTLGVLRWSPGLVGAAVGMSVGLLLPPISAVSGVNLAWTVVLAAVGLYLGKAFPEPILRIVVSVGGAFSGIALGAYVAGNMSVPLFAAPGIIVGGGVGGAWAAFA